MSTKAHILVVEDKAIIYKRLKMLLKEHNYQVDAYTPSVADAIGAINKKQPDLVLLDIDLQGEHNGIYLGNLLKNQYHIPFIYVTDFDDEQTFYESLQTQHADFIGKKEINLNKQEDQQPVVIQTKPHLDQKRLIRAVQTVLQQHKKAIQPLIKAYVMACIDYPKNIKNLGNTDVSQVPIAYKNIAYFTTNSEILDVEKTTYRKKNTFIKLDRNNTRIHTWEGKSYILSNNLSPIYKTLPHYFVRISEDYIVNISEDVLEGRINGKRLKIRGEIFTISETYRAEVEKRFDTIYQSGK